MSEKELEIIEEAKIVITRIELLEDVFRKAWHHLNCLQMEGSRLHKRIVDYEKDNA